MKTEKFMMREFNGNSVRQSTATGMFCASDLAKLSGKRVDNFKKLASTKSFIDEVSLREGIPTSEVITTRRLKEQGATVWMHPFLFIDFAMWINPEFKYNVLKWFYDTLIQFRNVSGDSFRAYNSALVKSFPEFFEREPNAYPKIANTIANACGVGLRKDKWETATEKQLELRDRIHNNIILLSDVTPDVPTCVALAIKKAEDAA